MTELERHSPGPWRWMDYREADGTWHLLDADGDSVLRVRDVEESFSMPRQDEPDARLIAAAPELLEALRALLMERSVLTQGSIDTAAVAHALLRRIEEGP